MLHRVGKGTGTKLGMRFYHLKGNLTGYLKGNLTGYLKGNLTGYLKGNH